MEPSINQEQLKNVIKTALVEVLEERQDLLCDAIAVDGLKRQLKELLNVTRRNGSKAPIAYLYGS